MNPDILVEFYRRYYKEIYLYLFAMCKNIELTEDLLQETFLRALISLPDTAPSTRAWLYTVARNLYFDKQRNDRHFAQNLSVQTMQDQLSPEPYERILQSEKSRLLYQALLQLDERKREILQLQYFGGMKQSEIASLLKIKPNHVRVLALRARREIRLWMEENGYEIS